MDISIIVAVAENSVIGKDNQLLWRLSEDLKLFKKRTTGHAIIMGRKTFDSIGKPLPGRTTVVVTRNKSLQIEGCIIAHSLNEAIAACAGDDEIFVVGGAELYAQALPLANTLYLTEIQQDIIGDAHFPAFNTKYWQEISRQTQSQTSPQTLDFHFVTYRHIP